MKNVIVLCTGNSFRSQMAEAFLRKYAGEKAQVYSAGVRAIGRLPEKTLALMDEVGIDIRHHTSDQVDKYLEIAMDYVITVCDHANETCPVWSVGSPIVVHQSFADPHEVEGQSFEEYVASLRPVRDEIDAWCKKWVEENL